MGQLVRHPLAIARACGTPHTAAVNIGKVQCETRIPAPHPLGCCAGKIGRVVYRRAKAGRTDIRAIAAGETPFRDLVPPWVVGVRLKQFLEPVGVEVSTHLTLGWS